ACGGRGWGGRGLFWVMGWRLALAAPLGVGAASTRSVAMGGDPAGGVVRSTGLQTTTSTSFVNLAGARVPGSVFGQTGTGSTLVIVDFTAESTCTGGNGGPCILRGLGGSQEAEAPARLDFTFHSASNPARPRGRA